MAVVEFRKNYPGLKGSMMAVGCTPEEIDPLVAQLTTGNVKIACFNSPTSLTISGDEAGINELQPILEQKQIFNRKLQVDVAYHSHHMNLAAKYYRKTLDSLDLPKSTSVDFHSSLLGHLIDGSQLEPAYWVDNLTRSVRFSEALATMCASKGTHKTGINLIVEIGPHSALAGPIKQILKSCGADAMKIPYCSALVRKRDALETALELASTLFVKGAALDLGAINLPRLSKQPSLLVDMPRYPWNHQTRYWHESRIMQHHKNRAAPRNDLLGTLAKYSNDMEPTWKNVLRIDDLPWLRHHKIQSLTLFPMSGFLSMAIEAAAQRAASRNIQYDDFQLRDVSVNTPLMMTDEDIEMTLQLRPHQENTLVTSDVWDEFRIHSWTATKGWKEHCRGLVAVKSNAGNSMSGLQSVVHEIMNSEMALVDKAKIYDSLSELGVTYGSSFQGMNHCLASNDCSMANITVIDTAPEMPHEFQSGMIIHPAFLEQLIEMYWPILGAGQTDMGNVYLPSSIGQMMISRLVTELTKNPGDSLRAICRAVPARSHPKPFRASMYATATDDYRPLIVLEDLTVSPIIESSSSAEAEPHRGLCYKMDWVPIFESSLPNGFSNGHSQHSNGVTNGIPNGVANGEREEVTPFPIEDISIVRGDSEAQIHLAARLAETLEHFTGKRPDISNLSDAKTKGKICLFLAEVETPLLSSLGPAQFAALQGILTSVCGVLWVVCGAYFESINPDANMVTGLSRSIRSETMLKFATLDLDVETSTYEEDTVQAILQIFKNTFGPQAGENCELEFTKRGHKFFTPRIINDEEMNDYVHKHTKGSLLEPTQFSTQDRALKIVIGTPGKLDTLHFIDQSVEYPLQEDELEIEVKAIGLNYRDALAVMGQLESFDVGFECSGIVSKAGTGASGFAIGDRIAGISVSSGVFSTYARLKVASSFVIRDNMTFDSAASIPIAYCTAHYSLLDLGRLQAEDSILIHGAESAAGQAAISLAQMIGAQISISLRNGEAKDSMKTVYGLRDDQILSGHALPGASTLHARKRKEKFDVVLKCESTDADTLRGLWDSVGSFGRFIEVEEQSISSRLDSSQVQSNRSFLSVDMISLAIERPKVLKRLIRDVSMLFRHERIKSIAQITTFPISEVESAFKALQSKVAGKLVVSPQPGDEVMVCFLSLFSLFTVG